MEKRPENYWDNYLHLARLVGLKRYACGSRRRTRRAGRYLPCDAFEISETQSRAGCITHRIASHPSRTHRPSHSTTPQSVRQSSVRTHSSRCESPLRGVVRRRSSLSLCCGGSSRHIIIAPPPTELLLGNGVTGRGAIVICGDLFYLFLIIITD